MKALRHCETQLASEADCQWRQVHPQHEDGGVVARDAFRGDDKAPAEVSTAQSTLLSAEQAFAQRQAAGRPTAGTWAVTVDEVDATGCRVVDDASCVHVTTPGHSFIDMRHLATKSEQRAARLRLAEAATERGRLHP